MGIDAVPFRGQLDEIEIVNRNMTGGEIQLIFQAGRAGSYSMRVNTMLMGTPSLADTNVAVAILGSAPFSVWAIDLTKPIVLSDLNTSTVPESTPNCQQQDVNNDGYLDLACELNRPAGSNIKQAYVRGFLINGEGFYASVNH